MLFIAIVQLTIAYSQEIVYQKSFSGALTQANKINKPVFILLTLPAKTTPDSLLKFENFASGFNSKSTANFYNKNFISYKVSLLDSDASKIRAKFHPAIFPAYIFLDTKGQIVYRSGGNYAAPEKYIYIAQQALNRISSGNTITAFEQLSKEGKISREQLKNYITLKQEFELFDNAELVDKYIGLLTINEQDDYNQVLFILKAGPYAFGKTYNLVHTNSKIIDSIYKREPEGLRKQINDHIIINTRTEAIKTKSITMAQNTASFVRSTWGKNYQEGNKNFSNEMLIYYREIKDTTNYYRQASNYYDTYYLNISADSAKKLQANTLDRIRESVRTNKPQAPIVLSGTDNRATFSRVVASSQTSDVAATLNTAVWRFYELGTHNTTYLVKALIWCHRAIELQPTFAYYDTMAHLMYRLNFYDEAILNQQKAIEMAMNIPVLSQKTRDYLKAELDKIKERTL